MRCSTFQVDKSARPLTATQHLTGGSTMGSFGGWLTPGGGSSGPDPREQVERSIKEHGWVLEAARVAFNSQDPLHCYYGEDCNPDEYLGYAEEFVKMFELTDVYVDTMETVRDRHPITSLDFVREIVRRTFGPCQFIRGWVSSEDIENIAQTLVNGGVKMSAEG